MVTATKEELTFGGRRDAHPGRWLVDRADEDLGIRYGVLQNFIGYSAKDVRTFCRLQRTTRLRSLAWGHVSATILVTSRALWPKHPG